MPYNSIAAAKKASFPTSAEGINLTLAQINKLAELYDAIKKAGTSKNPFSVAWTAWKRLYKKADADSRWTLMKSAAAIQFGTEQFVTATSHDNGIPDHAIQIEGRLIHLDKKNLAGWGVTAAAAKLITSRIPGVPIRACSALDPHACDYAFDTKSHIGYGLRAWIEDDWIMAAAAITDRNAADHIADGTWTPLGKGGWSVAGTMAEADLDFEKTGMLSDYQPTGISLVFAPAIPAFIGSGFDMVAAAVTNNHRGDNMAENTLPIDGGGTPPTTYTQEDLDVKIKEALDKQTADATAEAKKAADAELTKQRIEAAETLAKQKLDYDAAIEKLTDEDKAAFEARLTEMTPTADVEKMIAAAVTQGQANTLEAIERDKLITEYEGMLAASVVLGAPYTTDGKIDPIKLGAKMTDVQTMKVAAISSLINEAKMVAAAVPGKSEFDQTQVPGTPPGSGGNSDADLLADLTELDNGTRAV